MTMQTRRLLLLPLPLTLSLLSCSGTTQGDVVKAFGTALNNADYRQLASLSCKPGGPNLSIDEGKLLMRTLTNARFNFSETLRVESLEEDPATQIVPIRGSAPPLGYVVVVNCKGSPRVLTNGSDIRHGAYPISGEREQATLLNDVAWFYASNKLRPKTALALAEKATKLWPAQPELHRTLALCYLDAGQYEPAYFAMEGIVDKNTGRVGEPYSKLWEDIKAKLPPDALTLEIIPPTKDAITTQGQCALKLKVTPGTYVSFSGGAFSPTDDRSEVGINVSLSPDNNEITAAVRKYRYGLSKTTSLTIKWEKYQDNGDGTVTDPTTQLMWARKPIARDSWQASARIAQNLRLGGHSDWRLPTKTELSTLIKGNKLIDCQPRKYFPEVDQYNYWTSQSIDQVYALTFWFLEGRWQNYVKSMGDVKAIAVRVHK